MKSTFRLIEKNSLESTQNGYELQIRLNWYRSLPYSCIENVNVKINQEPVNDNEITFRINGHLYTIPELAELVEEFWFVQDTTTIVINQQGKVKPGDTAQLDVRIAVRAPYIPTAPGHYLTITSMDSLSMVAK